MTQEQHNAGCQQTESYSIRIGEDETFEERFHFEDPVPTGRQIIQKTGRRPLNEHQILLLTKDRQLEEIGLDETVDLRTRGVERFFIFRTDCLYSFVIDDHRLLWGNEKIKESTLRFLVGAGEDYSVWQERRRQDDLLIPVGGSACLSEMGVEVFFTGKDETNAG